MQGLTMQEIQKDFQKRLLDKIQEDCRKVFNEFANKLVDNVETTLEVRYKLRELLRKDLGDSLPDWMVEKLDFDVRLNDGESSPKIQTRPANFTTALVCIGIVPKMDVEGMDSYQEHGSAVTYEWDEKNKQIKSHTDFRL